MNTNSYNKCIRCGKPRIKSRTWKEGDITYSSFVCPDPECQKKVEAELKAKKDRLNLIKENAQKRRENRKKPTRK